MGVIEIIEASLAVANGVLSLTPQLLALFKAIAAMNAPTQTPVQKQALAQAIVDHVQSK